MNAANDQCEPPPRFWSWMRSSGLEPSIEAASNQTIIKLLPGITIACGSIALLGALAHILFLTPGLRPLAAVAHTGLISVGLYWLRKPIQRPGVAAFGVGLYLSAAISTYIVLGESGSVIHLAILVIGGIYLSLDRRLLAALLLVWGGCLSVIAAVWLPDSIGVSAIITCVISAVGGLMIRRVRISALQQVARLEHQLDTTIQERESAIHRAHAAEKFESLGLMAAGVAHDYNNLLVGVIGGADLAANATSKKDRDAALESIRTAADSLSTLSAQLLEVSGGRPLVQEPVDLAQLATHTLREQFSAALDSGRLVLATPPSTPTVRCEATSISKLLTHLVSNALQHASHRSAAVTVAITEESARSAERSATVRIKVADDGPGVPDELRSRIFDPFFSTQALGRGLGLALARAIARRHDTTLRLLPEGPGAHFELTLPAITTGLPAPTLKHSPPATTSSPTRLLLLLVDDDAVVRDITARMLTKLGYQVLEAASGSEALQIFEEARHPPALAVVDALMPVMDGLATIQRLRQRFPGVPALLYSGYHQAGSHAHSLPDDIGFLAKPFTLSQLSEALSAVLPEPRHHQELD